MADQKLPEVLHHVEATPMTVRAMREALAHFPEDAVIMTSGYEGDFTLALAPVAIGLERSAEEAPWYYGDWVQTDDPVAVRAVYVGGERHNNA